MRHNRIGVLGSSGWTFASIPRFSRTTAASRCDVSTQTLLWRRYLTLFPFSFCRGHLTSTVFTRRAVHPIPPRQSDREEAGEGLPFRTSSSSEAMIRWYAKQKRRGVLSAHDVPRLTKTLLKNTKLSRSSSVLGLHERGPLPSMSASPLFSPSQQAACLTIGAGLCLNGPRDPTPEYVRDLFLSLSVQEKEALAVFFFSRGILPSGLSADDVLHTLLDAPRGCVIPSFLHAALFSNPTLLSRVQPRYLRRCFELGLSLPSHVVVAGVGEPNVFKKRWIAWGEGYLPDHVSRCEVLQAAGLAFEAHVYKGYQRATQAGGRSDPTSAVRHTFLQTPSISESAYAISPAMWEPPRQPSFYSSGGFGPEVIAVFSQPFISAAALRKCCHGMPPLLLEYTLQAALLTWARRQLDTTAPTLSSDLLSVSAVREKNKSVPHVLLSDGYLTLAQLVHLLHFPLRQGTRYTAERLLSECRRRDEIALVMQHTRHAGVTTALNALEHWRRLFPDDSFYVVIYLSHTRDAPSRVGRSRRRLGLHDEATMQKRRAVEREEEREGKEGLPTVARLMVQLTSPSAEVGESQDARLEMGILRNTARRTTAGSSDDSNNDMSVTVPNYSSSLPPLLRAMTSLHNDMVSWSITRLLKREADGLEEALSVLSIALERGERVEWSILVDLLIACAKKEVVAEHNTTQAPTLTSRRKSSNAKKSSSLFGENTVRLSGPHRGGMDALIAILHQHFFDDLGAIFKTAFSIMEKRLELAHQSAVSMPGASPDDLVLVELVDAGARCGCFEYPPWIFSAASAGPSSSPNAQRLAVSLRQALRVALLRESNNGASKIALHREALGNLLQLSAELGFHTSVDVLVYDMFSNPENMTSCAWWWSSEEQRLPSRSCFSGAPQLISLTERLYERGLSVLWPLSVSEVHHRVQQQQHQKRQIEGKRSFSSNASTLSSLPSARSSLSPLAMQIHKAVRLAAVGCDDAPSFFTVLDSAQEWLGLLQSDSMKPHRASTHHQHDWIATRMRVIGDAPLVWTVLCASEMLRRSGNVREALRLLPSSAHLPLSLHIARKRCLESDPDVSEEALATASQHVVDQQQKEAKLWKNRSRKGRLEVRHGQNRRAFWCRCQRQWKEKSPSTFIGCSMPKRLASLMEFSKML